LLDAVDAFFSLKREKIKAYGSFFEISTLFWFYSTKLVQKEGHFCNNIEN